ncbi:EAL domain-containing protein [Methylonatrum kenyense]|uniref:EAL domain-containing protein n=1 Tax=Methylonatrum kenyense TaxID=455253 RepID=UPI0020BF97B7|nr:EAL domain-containing protein [Methylonatrum kenyense]MCK8517159.1 EAL domain-containing protein [Methylonatrum kenyense]
MRDDHRGKVRRPRLLILDDDASTGGRIQEIALSMHIDAVQTMSPKAFFELVQTWTPDLIVLNPEMPQVDGGELIDRLASNGCGAGLIFTGGSGQRHLEAAEDAARAHGLSIAGVLPRPLVASTARDLLIKSAAAAGLSEAAPKAPKQAPQAMQALADDLRQALADGAIRIVCQPRIHCHSGVLIGFEALARWRHPERGVVDPEIFIPLAEKHGLIDELTGQVADQAFQWLAGFTAPETIRHCGDIAPGRVSLTLNISACSLDKPLLFQQLVQRCRDLRLEPGRIVLELTESRAMQDADTIVDTLSRLHRNGFDLTVDHVGAGHLSIAGLVRLPCSEIKIDRRVVVDAAESAESRAIIRSLVALGHSLGVRLAAGGVGNADTLDFLREMECDFAQGDHIAPPLEPNAVMDWFIERERGREMDRLAALYALHLLDTPADHRFDRITRLCRQLFGVPTALISLVDQDRQWFKSRSGLNTRETPRTVSFCSHAIQQADPLVVSDTRQDPRFRDNPLVSGPPGIRFYAGQPLSLPGGERLGTLCLIDYVPRRLTADDLGQLAILAGLAEQEVLASRADNAQDNGICDHDTLLARTDSALTLCTQLDLQAIAIRVRPDSRDLASAGQRGQSPELIAAFERLLADTLEVADVIGWLDEEQLLAVILGADRYTATEALTRLAEAMDRWNRSRDQDVPVVECLLSAERLPTNRQLCAIDALRCASLLAETRVSS